MGERIEVLDTLVTLDKAVSIKRNTGIKKCSAHKNILSSLFGDSVTSGGLTGSK